jgi:hypothetical protein
MTTRAIIAGLLLTVAGALADEPLPVAALYLPDSVREQAQTNAALRRELREGLSRLWGEDTNDLTKAEILDMGWLQVRGGTNRGWLYVATMEQTARRLDDDEVFLRWRTRVRALGGELWRTLVVWTDTGLKLR